MKRQLESQIDDLYQLPLEEFTKARNALAKTLSGDDKRQVASLVKPSLPMWTINQLRWTDAATYDALIDASEKLRNAHRAALSGRKVDTRKPEELHRATVMKAFAKATSIGEKKEGRLTDAVRDAIRRTLAALPGEEPAGRLTREPPAAGFSLLTGVRPRLLEDRPGPISAKESAAATPRNRKTELEQRRRLKLAEKQQREADRKARQEEEKARREKEKRERDIKKAEQALREAERRLAELKG